MRTHEPLAARVFVARSMLQRMIGLLGHRVLDDGEGLILMACRSIHTYFMRFAIDAVFVDGAWNVVAISRSLPPWRFTPWVRRAQAVIELPAGTVEKARLTVGDQLLVQPVGTQKTEAPAAVDFAD